MPRGGARPGAGRPKGRLDTLKFTAASPEEESPVEYALRTMRDPAVDAKRRDSMARALLQFMRGSSRKIADDLKSAATSDDDEWTELLGR